MSCLFSTFSAKPTALSFSANAEPEGRALLSLEPQKLFRKLLDDKESEAVRWAAAALIDVTLANGPLLQGATPDHNAQTQDWAELVAATAARQGRLRACLGPRIHESPAARQAALLERAPIRLLAGVWLDGISQPATQPDAWVNRLFQVRHQEQAGPSGLSPQWMRHQKDLLAAGIALPGIDQTEFENACQASASTWLLAAFYLALAMYGASRFPEIVAVHWAFHTLGIDRLLGEDDADSAQAAAQAHTIADAFLNDALDSPEQANLRRRFLRAAAVCIELEALQVDAIARRIQQLNDKPLDLQMAEIVARHAPYAAGHHGSVKVEGKLLSERFSAPDFDAPAFVTAFKSSPYVRQRQQQSPCRFLSSIRFGGPMFGIFDAAEASIMGKWCELADAPAAPASERPGVISTPHPWDGILAAARVHPGFSQFETAAAQGLDDREIFFMLVNVEAYPGILPIAREIVRSGLVSASQWMNTPGDGTAFRYTDPRFFPYSPEALEARLGAIYRDKLLAPIAPLAEIPCADDVVFNQKIFALGNLIDGAWAYRIGLRGRHLRPVDAALFEIYADEMGQGIVAKNHIHLILQVLQSMEVKLAHIATREFTYQDELLDELYPFALFQLSLAQFPDTFHAEIVGFNLGIEMFGLGELRLHEIQKMRHWGFDTAYEATHLSIDNFGSGHARTSIAAITAHLAKVRRELGTHACASEWQRIWTGYASFAQFVETSVSLPVVEQPPGVSAPLH